MSQQIIIAVDHGNSRIKTPNHVFPSSYKESGHLPMLGADVVNYMGKEYVLTNRQMPQKHDKSLDMDHFLLTLFAIGKEIIGVANSPSGLSPAALYRQVRTVNGAPL